MNWPDLRIGEFCETGSGGTPSREEAARYYGGGIPWVKSGELRDDVLLATGETLTEEAVRESAARLIPKGAVLIAMYGATVGRTALLGIEATSNQAVCHIVPDPGVATPRFVWYQLRSAISVLLERRVGGAQPNISQKTLKDLKLTVPPLSEQRRIVEILDQADALRKLRAEADAKAERILPALFIKMFGDPAKNPMGWPTECLGELIEIGTHLVEPNDAAYLNLPHIGGEHIEKNSGRISSSLALVRDAGLKSGKFYFTDRHILYSKIRPYLNKVALPRFSGVCSADIYPLKPSDRRLSLWYLLVLLRSRAFLAYANRHASRLRMPKLNRKQLGAFTTPVPPRSLLMEFDSKASELAAIDDGRFHTSSKIERLFNSLLHRAFTGDLTASWREAHMNELLQEMKQQARALKSGTDTEAQA